jgi:hypothetical protein
VHVAGGSMQLTLCGNKTKPQSRSFCRNISVPSSLKVVIPTHVLSLICVTDHIPNLVQSNLEAGSKIILDLVEHGSSCHGITNATKRVSHLVVKWVSLKVSLAHLEPSA